MNQRTSGNLPHKRAADDLEGHLSPVDKIAHVELVTEGRDPRGRSKGNAIVEFETYGAAARAVQCLRDSTLQGRMILVRKYVEDGYGILVCARPSTSSAPVAARPAVRSGPRGALPSAGEGSAGKDKGSGGKGSGNKDFAQRIKAFQKASEKNNKIWREFNVESGTLDPKQHDAETLQDFATRYGVP